MEQLSIVINDMEDVTKAIDQAQRKACTSIVEIGYVLRKADDAELFRQKGYSSTKAMVKLNCQKCCCFRSRSGKNFIRI